MRITIIGVGLLGGSFGMAVRKAGAADRVSGVDLERDTLDRACERGAIDEGFLDLAEGVAGADLVVLATPVRSILALLPVVTPLLGRDTILFDLGSTKEAIVSTVSGQAGIARYVGGHPMAGAEHTGIEHADDGLLRGASFALVPPSGADEEAVGLLKDLVRRIGARPVLISAERHDRIVSITSHVPYLLSAALVLAAEETASGEECTWEFTASGFRDTSRLAASNVRVMADICLTNRQHILRSIDDVKRLLDELAGHIARGDETGLVEVLSRAGDGRSKAFSERSSD